jgi:hypothetical protein
VVAAGLEALPVRPVRDGVGAVNVSDVFYLINFLFAGGPAPPSCF